MDYETLQPEYMGGLFAALSVAIPGLISSLMMRRHPWLFGMATERRRYAAAIVSLQFALKIGREALLNTNMDVPWHHGIHHHRHDQPTTPIMLG